MASLLCDFVASSFRILYYTAEFFLQAVIPMRKSVKDEIILITGGGSGIGRLLAIQFAELGAVVVLWDTNEPACQNVAKDIKSKGGKAFAYCVDVTDNDSVYATAQRVAQDIGTVNILINNAGVVTGKTLMDSPDDKIKLTMNVNCLAHFWTTKAFLPAMMQANHGHIVTIASMAGLTGSPGLVDYSTSKFAVVGFDESLRNELAMLGMDGIKTTCVCPFFINTGMFEGAKTRFNWLIPILDQDYVANKIVDGVLRNMQFMVMPGFLYCTFFIKAMFPTRAVDECARFLGSFDVMKDFKGRQKA